MRNIADYPLKPEQAGLWFLGQAGYIIRSADVTVAIDPYLTDSVGKAAPDFTRRFPAPLQPEQLEVDIWITTHDHGDHLDPETIDRYPHRQNTLFVAPRLAAAKLTAVGIKPENIRRLDSGERLILGDLSVSGVFALPTGEDVLDTTGYLLSFSNGRSIYHTSDTAYTPLLLQAAPKNPEVLLVPINGKWGNLNVAQAVELTSTIEPRFVMPNHYDLMELNAENPATFRWICLNRKLATRCVIPELLQPFIWE